MAEEPSRGSYVIRYACMYACMYIAHITGYLISMTIALGPIARLFTRHIYFAIARRGSWHDYVLFLSNCHRN